MAQYFEESAIARTERVISGDSPYDIARSRISLRLGQQFSPQQITAGGPQVAAAAKAIAEQVWIEDSDTSARDSIVGIRMPRDDFVVKMLGELLGLGPIDDLIKDATIEDIAVNGPNEVVVFRDGVWYDTGITFEDSQRLLDVLNRGLANIGRQANRTIPIANGILPGGERISLVTDPISNVWPVASIRVSRTKGQELMNYVKPYVRQGSGAPVTPYPTVAQVANLSDDIVMPPFEQHAAEGGVMNVALAKYLFAAVITGLNIIVVGATGVGKTSLLTALGRALPPGKRMLIIEDTPEINIRPESEKPMNIISLKTRDSTLDGVRPVTQGDLVALGLRQRPDALTVGEARSGEILDLLTALSTGHKNGLTSLHTDSVEEVFERVMTMIVQNEKGRSMGRALAAGMMARSFHILLALDLTVDGRREIKSVAEYTGEIKGGDHAEPVTQIIFSSDRGKVSGPLTTSVHANKFLMHGFSPDIFQPV